MTGLELILAAVVCTSCSTNLPFENELIIFDSDSNEGIGQVSDMGHVDPSLDDAPAETLATLRAKQEKLRNLRKWINGKHLRIATLEDYPLSYTEQLENGARVGLGVSFEVIDFLREKFNFTYDVVVPQDNIIGSPTDFDRSLIEMLNSSNVDLAAAFIPSLSEQRSFIFYSTTTLDEGEWIMVMQRPGESASGSGLLAPFDFWVWILILVSLLVVGPIIYLLIILRNKLSGDGDQKPYSLGHCAWFVYGALMKQGSTLSPIADSTRLLFATWWIFITILTSFYTANLTAFLTLSKFTLPYNTINDVLTKNKHFVAARGGGIEYAIRTPNESLSMLNGMIQKNFAVFTDAVNDTLNLENYVEKNGYVFVRDRPAINQVLYMDYQFRKSISVHDEKVHCPFAMAKKPFMTKKRAFAYPIGSNLSELFDPELLNLVESGIIKHLSSKNLPNAEICPQDLGGTERQLRNGDLMMTYYIMMAGFATGLTVFSSEIIFRYINNRQSANKWVRHLNGDVPKRIIKLDKTQHLTKNDNVTPPPPYQSIFSSKQKDVNIFCMERWNGISNLNDVLLNDGNSGMRRLINGRDYMVFRNPKNGQSQLVPLRSPSAALFQYTYIE